MARPIFNEKDETGTRGAARYMDISEQATAKLVRDERIAATKVDGTWVITKQALDDYMANKGQRSQNGARKVFVYATSEQVDQLKALGFDPQFAFDAAKRREARKASANGKGGDEGVTVE